MSTLKCVIVALAASGCLAFHLETSRTLASLSQATSSGKSVRPPLRRRDTNNKTNNKKYSPRLSMMSFEGTAALAEAVSQAAYVLAEDASRGGAMVEQIPYIPAAEVMDFDKILLGSAACVLAYAWAAYEFGKRIVTQRACEVCEGSGLVTQSRSGRTLKQPIKCYACGGFLPWENWGRFWQSNMNVGNGGVLQRPASDYDELNEAARAAKENSRTGQDDDTE